ncbi:MAG: serine/threonine-protein phosphatase, partial [Nocardioidaceae bacterium]|nr:serine/threonine-protein phosphatase [Nocardioidaceae bacterium]
MEGLRSWRPATVETLDLPAGWTVESTLVAASGGLLAGDFVIAAPRLQGQHLELAVVDVSGKGDAASLRARPLSEVMDGFLADLPAADFLVAANKHLIDLDWEEGFATAVHLSLDVRTGAFVMRSAGHPPAVHWQAEPAQWHAVDAEGVVLGVVEQV